MLGVEALRQNCHFPLSIKGNLSWREGNKKIPRSREAREIF